MKKFLVNYYPLITQLLFIIYNIVLKNLRIGGYLYQIYMLLFIGSNIFVLIKMRKYIKCKSLAIVIAFLTCIFSKDSLQCLFDITSMINLIIIGFMESNFVKVITILIAIFIIKFFVPLQFAFLIFFVTDGGKLMNDVYEETHYYCDNNYEAYAYSSGAWDSAHYSIGMHYEILNIDDIIHINYNKRNEKSEQEYKDYIKNNNCNLIGNKGGG